MIIGNSRYAPLWLSIISTARWWNNLKRRVEADCQTNAVVHRQTDTDNETDVWAVIPSALQDLQGCQFKMISMVWCMW